LSSRKSAALKYGIRKTKANIGRGLKKGRLSHKALAMVFACMIFPFSLS